MTETMCDSGAVKLKAGANAVILTAPQYTQLINQAESFINVVTGVNYTDSYGSLNDDLRRILEDVASSHAAVAVINNSMGGFTSRAEAQTMLDVNYTRVFDGIDLIKLKTYSDRIV
jgi:hypothetical protein